MSTAWTLTFTAPLRDAAEDLAESVNGIAGAALQQALRPALAERGWGFCEPFAEDFGWFSDLAYTDEGKRVAVALATGPEGETRPDGGAEDDRWRVVISMDLGMFAKTKARRSAAFGRLAGDLHAACLAIGATGIVWEEGGPLAVTPPAGPEADPPQKIV